MSGADSNITGISEVKVSGGQNISFITSCNWMAFHHSTRNKGKLNYVMTTHLLVFALLLEKIWRKSPRVQGEARPCANYSEGLNLGQI